MQITQMFQQFARDEEGANAIEYGLVAAVVAVVICLAGALVLSRYDEKKIFSVIGEK